MQLEGVLPDRVGNCDGLQQGVVSELAVEEGLGLPRSDLSYWQVWLLADDLRADLLGHSVDPQCPLYLLHELLAQALVAFNVAQ